MQCVWQRNWVFSSLILTRSVLTVCWVGRTDKAEHNPGSAGCSLPPCLHVHLDWRRESVHSRQPETADRLNSADKNCCFGLHQSRNVYCVFVSYKPLSPVQKGRVFWPLCLHGGGEPRKRGSLHGNRKAMWKCSTVGAPWIERRRMSNLHCGCWLLGASYIVKEATTPQSESISVVFPVEYQRGDCGLLVSAL